MSRREHLSRLRQAAPVVLPSLLNGDFANLEREVSLLEQAGVRGFHLDVMDGNFVPNISFGLPIVEAMRRSTQLPLDVHLMIAEPARFVDAFHTAGADIITFHVEAVDDPRPILQRIRDLDAGAGLVLNPATPLERLDGALDLCDLVLVMSVEAGFGGQSFDRAALDKLRALRARLGDRVLLEIDGGVNQTTIADCTEAGADLLVVGTAILHSDDYAPVVRDLSRRAALP